MVGWKFRLLKNCDRRMWLLEVARVFNISLEICFDNYIGVIEENY